MKDSKRNDLFIVQQLKPSTVSCDSLLYWTKLCWLSACIKGSVCMCLIGRQHTSFCCHLKVKLNLKKKKKRNLKKKSVGSVDGSVAKRACCSLQRISVRFPTSNFWVAHNYLYHRLQKNLMPLALLDHLDICVHSHVCAFVCVCKLQ